MPKACKRKINPALKARQKATVAWNKKRGWRKGCCGKGDVKWQIPKKGTAGHRAITKMVNGC